MFKGESLRGSDNPNICYVTTVSNHTAGTGRDMQTLPVQRVPVMQNAEFYPFLYISCPKNLIIYMLVNKE